MWSTKGRAKLVGHIVAHIEIDQTVVMIDGSPEHLLGAYFAMHVQ